MIICPNYMLNNDVKIPVIGLGVLGNPAGAKTEKVVQYALQAGYRHIDTAKAYKNEEDVGKAVAACMVPREELFIVTKLWNEDQGYDSTLHALDESLHNLKMDYVDLYLMHWPLEGLRLESWQAMETALAARKVRAIGVSNFMRHHIEELLNHCKVIPAINQIELSPFNYLYRKDTIDTCLRHGIAIEAYSPLTKGRKLHDANLMEIAGQYRKTIAQLLIRWNLEHKFVVIPKSSNKTRIIENAGVFDFSISREDMCILDGLNENLITAWDPTNVP